MPSIEKKSFNRPDEVKTPFPKMKVESVNVGGLVVNKETLEPGWKWSDCVKPSVKTESCQKFHVKFIISGSQLVVMDDGTKMKLEPGDLAVIQPGHDAWVVGNEPNILLELASAVKQL